MKLIKVLSSLGVAILPHLAFADTTPAPDLGPIKAMLDYCSQIDPADAATFKRMWDSAADREKTSLSPASGFQAIYDSTTSRLKTFSRSGMVSACHSGASQWGVRARPTSGPERRPSSNPGHSSHG
jgi:hypothetical protein